MTCLLLKQGCHGEALEPCAQRPCRRALTPCLWIIPPLQIRQPPARTSRASV
ncbi:MAG: hypothetical protein JWQ63_317 [Mucilaginibacter sp.]|nr:hypothetical protein [Mucilaginibacter sp.]